MKKLIALLLVLALVFTMAACAHPTNPSTIQTDTDTTEPATDLTTQTEPTAAQPDATDTATDVASTTEPEDVSTTSEAEKIDESGVYKARSPLEYEHEIPDFAHPETHEGVAYVEVLGILLESATLPKDISFPTEPLEAGVWVGKQVYPDDPYRADLEARAFTINDTIMSYSLWNGADSLPLADTINGQVYWVTTCWFDEESWVFLAYFGDDDGFRSYPPWSDEQQKKRKIAHAMMEDLFSDGSSSGLPA